MDYNKSFLSSFVQKLLGKIQFNLNQKQFPSQCFIEKNNLIYLDFNYLNIEIMKDNVLFEDEYNYKDEIFDHKEEKEFFIASKNIQFISRCIEYYVQNNLLIDNINHYEINDTYINDDYVCIF